MLLLRRGAVVVIGALSEAPGIELAARLEGLDTARLALDLAVGAVEEVGDKGADLVAEAGLGGGEGWLGEELVVLWVCRTRVGLCQ